MRKVYKISVLVINTYRLDTHRNFVENACLSVRAASRPSWLSGDTWIKCNENANEIHTFLLRELNTVYLRHVIEVNALALDCDTCPMILALLASSIGRIKMSAHWISNLTCNSKYTG